MRKILTAIVTFAVLSPTAGVWAQFGDVNQMMRQQQQMMNQQQRQIQQQVNQAQRMAQQAGQQVNIQLVPNNTQQSGTQTQQGGNQVTNIQVQQGSGQGAGATPNKNFVFTRLELNPNGQDDSGRDVLQVWYNIKANFGAGRISTIIATLTLEQPQGTPHKDSSGRNLVVQAQPMNGIGNNVAFNNCWLGFYKEYLNPLPGTNTYYARITLRLKDGTIVAQSKYLTFTMTGEEPKSESRQTASDTSGGQTRQKADGDSESDAASDEPTADLGHYAVTDRRLNVRAGTPIAMRAVRELTVEDANEGDLIDFIVAEDVFEDGAIIVPQGASGKAEVLSVDHGTDTFSTSESMQITPIYVRLPNGERLPLAQKKLTISGANASHRSHGRGKMKRGYGLNATVAETTSILAYSKTDGTGLQQTTAAPVGGHVNNSDINSPLTGNSDIDRDIPKAKREAENTFAVIIANEDYANEAKVEFAINDGRAFKEYCRQTLGLPDLNIHYSENATKNSIVKEIDWVSHVAEAFGSDAKIIIYYAGHGIPDEQTQSAYLLPVDGIGTNVNTGYGLNELYGQLSALPASSVTVLMDACFSGTKRGEGMLASARSVAIKAKPAGADGNLVVLSAAQGDETAYPYKEKGHGLFTYFLLKKLQESQGECSLRDLSEYVKKQVSRHAIVVNGKPQTPTVDASPETKGRLGSIRLK